MIVVKLFTRRTNDGKRKWVEANPKGKYPEGTVFYLRWLPGGATNYSVKAPKGNHTYRSAMRACVEFEPEEQTSDLPKPVTFQKRRHPLLNRLHFRTFVR